MKSSSRPVEGRSERRILKSSNSHLLDAKPGEVDPLGQAVDCGIDGIAERSGKPGGPEDAEGILGEGGRVRHPEDGVRDVAPPAEGVDDPAVAEAGGDAVAAEIPALEVLFDGEGSGSAETTMSLWPRTVRASARSVRGRAMS